PTAGTGCSCWPLINDGSAPALTLPTPCARDGRGVGLPYGLPDLIQPGGTRHHLLPTPTATPYGSNQSPSAGAAVRPSLDRLARDALLPTPTVADSRASANAT